MKTLIAFAWLSVAILMMVGVAWGFYSVLTTSGTQQTASVGVLLGAVAVANIALDKFRERDK